MTKAQEIEKLMTALQISKEEAEQLWEDDHSDEVLPEVAEMERKAKQIRRYEKSDTPRKKSEKIRKVDEEKKRLLADYRVLTEGLGGQVTAVKNEAELSFTFNGNSYTLKLIKHRPPKA